MKRKKVAWKKGISKETPLLDFYLDAVGRQGSGFSLINGWEGFQNSLVVYSDGVADIYLDSVEERDISEKIIDQITSEPSFLDKFEQQSLNVCKVLVEFTQSFSNGKFEKKTNGQLGKGYLEFCQKYADTYKTLLLGLWPVQRLVDDWLEEAVPSQERTEIKTILTFPTQSTPLNQERNERGKLIDSILKDKEIRAGVSRKPSRDYFLSLLSTREKNHLEEHFDRYQWLFADLSQSTPSFLEFVGNLVGQIVEGESSNSESRPLSRRQKELLNSLNPHREIRDLLKLLRFYAFLRMHRRTSWSKSLWMAKRLFQETAKRLDTTEYRLKYLTPKEVDVSLRGEKFNYQSLIKSRVQKCTLLMVDGKIKIYTGREMEEMVLRELPVPALSRSKTLKGTSVFIGRVKGPVRVIRKIADLRELKQGEILVAQNTTPDYVMAINRAVGIVTEMGGVTCHAALIAREFQIPCLVGVENATGILKTGEQVIIDTKQGLLTRTRDD